MHIMLDMNMHEAHIRRMTLDDFLKKKRKTEAEFAAEIGLSQSQVNRLRTTNSMPSWATIEKISAATRGKVTANDFAKASAA